MKLTLEALEVLDAIDKKGSFAGAAESLFRVPSAITYTVQKLEQDLNFAIFRKEGRRSIITPAGQLLLEQGRELLLNAQAIIENAHQVDSGWERQVNIAVDTVWDLNKVLLLIKEFHQLKTGVQVNLYEEVMGGSLESIIEGKVDLVVGGPSPVNSIQGIKFKKIMDAKWLFVVAKEHPLCEVSKPLTEADIAPYYSVVIRDSSKNSPILSHRAFSKQTVLKVASMEQKIAAQLQGIGVGFLPEHKIQPELIKGDLVALEIQKEAPSTPQYCSWRIANKGKAMRWFMHKVLEDA